MSRVYLFVPVNNIFTKNYCGRLSYLLQVLAPIN
jgi:hypothetical protein